MHPGRQKGLCESSYFLITLNISLSFFRPPEATVLEDRDYSNCVLNYSHSEKLLFMQNILYKNILAQISVVVNKREKN